MVEDLWGAYDSSDDRGGEQRGLIWTGELHGVLFCADIANVVHLELKDPQADQYVDQSGPHSWIPKMLRGGRWA